VAAGQRSRRGQQGSAHAVAPGRPQSVGDRASKFEWHRAMLPLPTLCDHHRCSPGACCWHPLEHLHCRGGPLRRAHRLARPRPTRRRAASIAQSTRLLLSSDLVSVPWIVGGIRSELGSLVGYFVRPQTSSSPSPGYIDVRAAHPAPACAALPKRAPASELRETTMYPIGQAGGAG
jgi:hypothetical protein